MTGPGVSIALATFNGEKYLEPQLHSLAAQTRPPTELVVVDDGSVDATKAIIRGFAETAPFPVSVHENQSRLGYRGNFMRAAGFCRSDLIAFCDQDDVWAPEKLAVMVPLFDDAAVLLAYHNATAVDEAGTPIGELYDSTMGRKILPPLAENPWRLVKGFTQMFRRGLLQHFALQPASLDPYWPGETLAHDQWFVFLASVLGLTVRLGEPLARYRQHPANEHGWTPQSYIEPRPHFLLGEGFIAAAKNRVELLRRLPEQPGSGQRANVAAAIDYYERLQRRLSERVLLYQSPSIAARAGTVRALLRQGAYQNRAGAPGFGWSGLAMDVCAGVMLGPRAKGLL